MSALSLPPHAMPPGDPVSVQLRGFAASYGVVLPEPVGALGPVWEALRAAGARHPGLAFAGWTEILALGGGLLSSLLANSPDVGALLDDLERVHPLFDRDQIILTRNASSVSVTMRAIDGGPAHPDTVDSLYAMLCRSIVRLAGAQVRPSHVLLRRAAPADRGPYEEIFGEVAFGQPADACVFARSVLRVPISQADPVIRAMLDPYLRRRIGHRQRPWSSRVSQELTADPAVPVSAVASALNVSTRTLQLRLAAEGTSFSAVADSLRRERALAMLAQPGYPITAIAVRLGFATPAAFTRAFRRWTGVTPTHYRSQR